MEKPEPKSISWGQRALEHATTITNASPGRGSATQAEAQAADYVRQQLEGLKIEGVRTQNFSGLRSIWLFLALAFGLALVGHAAFWLLRGVLGNFPASVVFLLTFGLSGYLLWRQFAFRSYPLGSLLPHGPSQNVIAIMQPRGEIKQRAVLVGHLDSHRAVFWFATDWLLKLFALSEPVAMFGVFIAPVLYLLAILTGWQVFAWVNLYLALNHFMGWFTGVTADLGPYSPGANDNAAAAGSLLALAERLRERPLEQTELWLAFTGCEESGCDGMVTLLQEHGEQLKDALFVDLELVGIGDQLVYVNEEGTLRPRHISTQVERLVSQAGQAYGIRPFSLRRVGAFTENGTAWEHGFNSVCLMAQQSGVSLMPEWHRLSDVPSRLSPETLGRVNALVWDLLHRLDA